MAPWEARALLRLFMRKASVVSGGDDPKTVCAHENGAHVPKYRVNGIVGIFLGAICIPCGIGGCSSLLGIGNWEGLTDAGGVDIAEGSSGSSGNSERLDSSVGGDDSPSSPSSGDASGVADSSDGARASSDAPVNGNSVDGSAMGDSGSTSRADAGSTNTEPDAATRDAGADASDSGGQAAAPSIVSLSIPAVVEASKSAQISASIRGAAGDSIEFAWSASQGANGGTYAPQAGTYQLDSTGAGTLTTTYTAPLFGGPFGQLLALGSVYGNASQSFSTNVAVPADVGYPNAFSPAVTVTTGSNFLLGEQVTISSAATVVRLAFLAGAPAQNAQLAIYSDMGGGPHALVAQTGVFTVVGGPNEVAVTQPELLSPGPYWLMVDFSQPTLITESTGSDTMVDYVSFSLGTALPATISGATVTNAGIYNLYAVLLE